MSDAAAALVGAAIGAVAGVSGSIIVVMQQSRLADKQARQQAYGQFLDAVLRMFTFRMKAFPPDPTAWNDELVHLHMATARLDLIANRGVIASMQSALDVLTDQATQPTGGYFQPAYDRVANAMREDLGRSATDLPQISGL